MPQVLQRAQEQAGGDQQDERDRDLQDQQRLLEQAARAGDERLVSFSAALTFIAVARKRRSDAEHDAGDAVTASTNDSTRQSSGVA